MSKSTLEKLAPWAAIVTVVAALLGAGGPEVRQRAMEFLLVAGFFGGAFAMMVQHIAAKWWTSEIGRHLFVFAAAIGSGCGLPALTNWLGYFPGQDWIAVVVVVAIVGSLYWRISIMVREVIKAVARDAGHRPDGHSALQSVDRAS